MTQDATLGDAYVYLVDLEEARDAVLSEGGATLDECFGPVLQLSLKVGKLIEQIMGNALSRERRRPDLKV